MPDLTPEQRARLKAMPTAHPLVKAGMRDGQVEATRQQHITKACAPFDRPELRQTLATLKQESKQALDIFTPDEVMSQGFDEAGKTKAGRAGAGLSGLPGALCGFRVGALS